MTATGVTGAAPVAGEETPESELDGESCTVWDEVKCPPLRRTLPHGSGAVTTDNGRFAHAELSRNPSKLERGLTGFCELSSSAGNDIWCEHNFVLFFGPAAVMAAIP